MPAAKASERIKFGATIVAGHLPLGGDPTFLFKFVKSGIERAVAHLKHFARNISKALAEDKPIHGLEGEELEEEEVESALHEAGGLGHKWR